MGDEAHEHGGKRQTSFRNLTLIAWFVKKTSTSFLLQGCCIHLKTLSTKQNVKLNYKENSDCYISLYGYISHTESVVRSVGRGMPQKVLFG